MINTIKTRIDTARTLPIALHQKHGESVLVSIAIFNNGKALRLNDDVTATLFYRSNELDATQWYKASNNVGIDNDAEYSVVNLIWTGKLDNGADFYEWFIQLADNSNLSYSIFGTISLEQSPGFVPNSIKLPVQVLDYSAFEVKNAPYYSQAFLDNELDKIKKDINDIRKDVSGDADASFTAHMENFNNPHKVSVEQLTKRSASAGACSVSWSDSSNNYYKGGNAGFYFDPVMYRKGQGYCSITFPEFTTIDGNYLGNAYLRYVGNFVFAEEGNYSDWIFRSENTVNVNGVELYVFVAIDVPALLRKESPYAVWVGVGSTKNPSAYEHSAEVVTASHTDSYSYAPISSESYEQSGVYRVLTEECLRDTKTGYAYSLRVEDGQLRLVRYTEKEF